MLKKVFLDDKKTLSIQKFYLALSGWYDNWYNSININKLGNQEKVIFGKDPENLSAYYTLCEDVEASIWEQELFIGIIGEMGEWGSLRVDEVIVEDLATIVKNGNTYSIVFYVLFGLQTYSDHEYFDNGSETCFVKATGTIVNNQWIIWDMRWTFIVLNLINLN